MHHRRRHIFAALFGTLLAGGAAGAESPGNRHAAEVEQLLPRLSSDDWRVRQQAFDRLVRLGGDALPRLEKVAATAADDEARTRAAAAVAQIQENRQTGASLVSVSLKGVPAADAFAEVTRQARAALPTDPPGLLAQPPAKRVSLEADHRPFWEVMQSLCAQTGVEPGPIMRQNRDAGLGLSRGDPAWQDRPTTVAGPLLVRADRITRTSTVQLKAPRDVMREFNISLTVYAEPKLRVLDYSGALRLEEVVDERGNSLIPPADADAAGANADAFGNLSDGATSRWEVGATLHHPKGAGRRIARLRATTTLHVQARAATLEAPVAGGRNVQRTLDGLRVAVKHLDASRAEMTIHRDGRSDADWYGVRMQLYAGHAKLLDDQGRAVARNQNGMDADEAADGQQMELKIRFAREPGEDGGGGGKEGRDANRKRPPASEATRFVWEFPVEVRELVVPVEFRDLPIP